MPGPVRILLFATARQAVGRPHLERPVPAGGVAVDALVGDLAREFPKLVVVLRSSRYFRNGRVVHPSRDRVYPGDEFAIHPPYSGG